MKCFLVAGVLGALASIARASAASASSPAAWDAFRSGLRAKRRAAARGRMTRVQVQVETYGSESYGFALRPPCVLRRDSVVAIERFLSDSGP